MKSFKNNCMAFLLLALLILPLSACASGVSETGESGVAAATASSSPTAALSPGIGALAPDQFITLLQFHFFCLLFSVGGFPSLIVVIV